MGDNTLSETRPVPRSVSAILTEMVNSKIRAEQLGLLDELVVATYPKPETLSTFRELVSQPNKRLALEFISRMPVPIPAGVLLLAAQALQNRDSPWTLRLNVAAKLLSSLPDTSQAVGPVLRSLTTQLSRSRTLEKLIQLQSRVEHSDSLDSIVEDSLHKVLYKCPRCRRKLTRTAMIQHMWFDHRLVFEQGRVRDSHKRVEESMSKVIETEDPEQLEETYRLTELYFPEATTEQVLQAIISRQLTAGVGVPKVLLQEAEEKNHGLCPKCLNPVPDQIVPLPAPLSLGGGRLAGDGYAITVSPHWFGYQLEIQTPRSEKIRRSVYGPRGWATIGASIILTLAIVLTQIGPSRWFVTLWPLVIALLLSGLVYGILRLIRPQLPDADDLALDTAWTELTHQLGRSKLAIRFLIRLCRASLNVGQVSERAPRVQMLVEHGAQLGDQGDLYTQFFGVVQVLQVNDQGVLGKDRLPGCRAIFERYFQGSESANFVEAAAQVILEDCLWSVGDRHRLRMLLLDLAFSAGFSPRDLLRVFRFLPNFRQLFSQLTPEELRQYALLAKSRFQEIWLVVGQARTVYQLAEELPGWSRKFLIQYPDALLKIELPEAVERVLGDMVLTTKGLVIAGRVLTDPQIEIRLEKSPRGFGWSLSLGRHRIDFDRKLPAEITDQIRAWLRFRHQRWLVQAELQVRTHPQLLSQALKSLCTDCLLCGETCLCRAGKLGESWPLTENSIEVYR